MENKFNKLSEKEQKILDIKKISNIEITQLQQLIKPSGFFNQKADRIKNIAVYLHKNYHNNLNFFFSRDILTIREELLSLKGIGPETADSILLYAGNMPIFVVDAYTKRLCKRIPLDTKTNYDDIQNFFEVDIQNNYSKKEIVQIYNELHVLIVEIAKNYCKTKPKCAQCILQKQCNYSKKLL